MSITPETKFYRVVLEFPLESGTVTWATQVPAEDEDGAVKEAANALWAEFDYKGIKPKVDVRECYVVENHDADPGVFVHESRSADDDGE